MGRRLPTPEERKRSGGAGIYYHFDYVGGPRNYKWIDTNPIPKIREQMNLALNYGAARIWIVNVGDLKPMEFPIDFFSISLAIRSAGPKRNWASSRACGRSGNSALGPEGTPPRRSPNWSPRA